MRFVIKNKLYDTSKMVLVAKVEKWYEYTAWFQKQLFGEGVGRLYDCDLYRSQKGNWLLVHSDSDVYKAEAISECEAKSLLMHYDYDAFAKEFGELEEA